MDSLIRFCFLINPEEIEDMGEYAKLYSQARWVIEYASLWEAKKAINGSGN